MLLLLAALAALLAAPSPSAGQASAWEIGDALVVTEVTVGDSGEPLAVHLAWPAPSADDVEEVEVLRNGERLGATSGAAFIDEDPLPPGTPAEYRAVAVYTSGGTSSPLGSPTVDLADTRRGCTFTWTGAASAAWEERRSWAPVVAEADSGTVGLDVPGSGDLACIDTDRRLPVEVTTDGLGVGAVDGSAGVFIETLDVMDGSLTVEGAFHVNWLRVSGGTLGLKAGGTTGAGRGNTPDVILEGGELRVDGTFAVGRLLRIDGDTSTIAGAVTTQQLQLGSSRIPSTAELIGDGASLTATESVTAWGDPVLSGTGVLATPALHALDGEAAIGWTLDTAAGAPAEVWVEDGTLLLPDVAALAADATWESVDLVLEGKLDVGPALQAVGGRMEVGVDGVLLSGGDDTPFAGLSATAELAIDGADVGLTAGLQTAVLDLDDASLTIPGALTGPTAGVAIALDESTLTVGDPLVLTDGWSLAVQRQRPSTLAADLTVAIPLDLAGTDDGEGSVRPLDLTIDGDLTLADGAEVTVDAGPSEGSVTVTGGVDLDAGTLLVTVGEDLPDGATWVALGAGSTPTGPLDAVKVDGPGAGSVTAVELAPTGILLRGPDDGGSGGSDDCVDVPDVLGLAVVGCWADDGNGVYRTSLTVAAQHSVAPAIAGISFTPTADVDLLLDVEAGTLRSVVAGTSELGDVQVTIPIVDGRRQAATQARAAATDLDLGTFGIDWDLARQIDLPAVADLLGLPLPSGPVPVLSVAEGQWLLDLAVLLPDLFDAPQALLSLPITENGIDAAALTTGEVTDVVLGEVARLQSLVLTWARDTTWDIATAIGDPLQVDGSATFDGGLDAGSLTVEGLTVAGFGDPDAAITLTFDRSTSRWAGSYVAGSGATVEVAFITGGGGVTAGGVGLSSFDLGLATLDRLRIVRQPSGRWDLEGQVITLDGTSAITGELTFEGGAPSGFVTLQGGFGPLGTLDPLTLTITDGDGIDHPEAATVYGISGTMRSGGDTSTLDGFLVVLDGTPLAAELDADLAIGELAQVEGLLQLDQQRWRLVGRDGAPDATLSCDGGTSRVRADFTLVAGEVRDGELLATDGLCFGLTSLESFRLTARDATTFDVTATITRPEGGTATATGQMVFDGERLTTATLQLPELSIGGLVEVPPSTWEMTRTGDVETWSVRAGTVIQQLSLGFTDGTLVAADILLGDGTAPIASWGDWLAVDQLGLTFPEPGDRSGTRWQVTGSLSEPDVDIDGFLQLDGGVVTGGALDVDAVEIGSIARLDVLMAYVGGPTGRTWSIDATLLGDGFAEARNAAGSLTFADGGLEAGHLQLERLPIGELATVEGFRLQLTQGNQWALSGGLVTDRGTTLVAGTASFDDGTLLALTLELDRLPLGPASIERFVLSLDRAPTDDNRVGTYRVSGVVVGPAQLDAEGEGSAPLEPVTGAMTFVDGTLTDVSVQVPSVELGGLARLTDLDLGYSRDTSTGTATLTSGATVASADDAFSAAASIAVTVKDGRIIDVTVDADDLVIPGLGGITNLQAIHDIVDGIRDCPGLDGTAPRGTQLYALSGTMRATGQAFTGCLGIADGALVAAQLTLGTVSFGEVLTLESLQATYLDREPVEVPVVAGGTPTGAVTTLTRTTLSLSATLTAAGQAPTDVEGQMVLMDGGLAAFEVGLTELPLLGGVAFRDVRITFDQQGRWDGVSDTTYRIQALVEHAAGTTSMRGGLSFLASGELATADMTVEDLPLGPVLLDRFAMTYVRTADTTAWGVAGLISVPGGESFGLTGSLALSDGAVTSALVDVPRLPIGEILLLQDLSLSYALNGGGGSEWEATGTVGGLQPGAGQPATGELYLAFAPDGAMTSGSVSATQVRFGGLLRLDQLRLDYDTTTDQQGGAETTRWDLTARAAVGGGSSTEVTGHVVLRDRRVTDGQLLVTGLPVGDLVRIDTLDVEVIQREGRTLWDGEVAVSSRGQTSTGEATLRFGAGTLQSAYLQLGEVRLSEAFTIEDLALSIPDTTTPTGTWMASASIRDEDGVSTLGGSLTFDDGRVVGGGLELADVQLGPVELSELIIDVSSDVTPVDGGPTVPTDDVCGVAAQVDEGTRWAMHATVATADGDTSSLGGRLQVAEGTVREAVLCGDDLQIAEMALLDDVLLRYAAPNQGNPDERWRGAATVVGRDGATSASLDIAIRDRQLQEVVLEADGLQLAEAIALDDVLLSYDRSTTGTAWALGATLARTDGVDTAVTGSLQVDDGTIVAGSISIAELPFGELLVLDQLQLDYHGRQHPRVLPREDRGFFMPLFEDNGCAGTAPTNGDNIPANLPVLDVGPEALFSLSASVSAGDVTYAAGGLLAISDGAVSALDVTLDCMPFGGLVTVEDARLAFTREGSFRIGGRLASDDPAIPSPGAYASLDIEDGRAVGGGLRLRGLPLGFVRLEELTGVLQANPDGSTTYALDLEVDADGQTYGGGGSMRMLDNRIVGGSLNIDGIPVAELFTIETIQLGFDDTDDGLVLTGAGEVGRAGSTDVSTADLSLTLDEGQVVGGSIAVSDGLALFGAVPIRGFSLGYDGDDGWSGSLQTALDGVPAGPAIAVGFGFDDGKLVDGLFGFDADGDGAPDPADADDNPPLSGDGSLRAFPLRALLVQFCSEGSTAGFCSGGVRQWEGRIALELPTDAAPSVEGFIIVREGRVAGGGLTVDGLGIPLFSGIFLDSLGASYSDPPLNVEGQMGIFVGSPGARVVDIDGTIGFTEKPPLAPGQDYRTYEPEYLQFYLRGDVDVAALPLRGQAYLEVNTNGLLRTGGSLVFDPVDWFSVEGGVDGSVWAAGALPGAVDPRDGSALTGPGFQVSAFLRAILIGYEVAHADFVANTIGAGACAGVRLPLVGQVRIGGGVYWSPFRARIGCDLGRYEIAAAANQTRAGTRQAGVAESHTFEVPDGEDLLGVDVLGEEGQQPDVILVAPDGTEYAGVDTDPTDDGILIARDSGQHLFLISSPLAGGWKVVPQEGSAEIAQVEVSFRLPDIELDVDATVEGGMVRLDYDVKEIEGQDVTFLDRRAGDPDSAEPVGVVPGSRTRSAAGATSARAIDSRQGGATISGSMTVHPAGEAAGGDREVIAVITQDGIPREQRVVATYTAPAASPAGAPLAVTATEAAGGAVVTWQPPADDGGREITRYRIRSTTGASVTAPADARTITLPIPAMSPGEVVPVVVQAWTTVGWGTPATTTFTATQTTELAYLDTGEVVIPDDPFPGGGGTGGDGTGDGSGDGSEVPDEETPLDPAEAEVTRLAGATRIETAVAISQATFDAAEVVFIATGGAFPDALAGGPAAAGEDGPVLLVGEDLPAVVAEEIRRLGPSRIVVLGGVAAVPEGVAAALAELAPVTRLAGPDRFATAAAISAASHPGTARQDLPGVVYLATGSSFPDALSGGAAAARDDGPLLLATLDGLPSATAEELARLDPDRVVLLGGTAALGPAVEAAVADLLPAAVIERLAGADRFATSAAIAQTFASAEVVFIATGGAFPDALAGIPAAAADGAPLLLVGEDVPAVIAEEIRRLDPSRIVVLGGEAAVPRSVETALRRPG